MEFRRVLFRSRTECLRRRPGCRRRHSVRSDLCGRGPRRPGVAVRRPRKARDRLRPQLRQFRVGPVRQPRRRGPRCAARTGDPGPRPQLRSARLRPYHRRHAGADPPPARRARRDLEPMTTPPSNPAGPKPLLVFDMDGVLVDVTESYRETIARTVEHFTGRPVTRTQIQEQKNQGGFNDDWKLSHHLVTAAGVDVPFEEVRAHFQSIFLPDAAGDGLMLRERWVARPGTLEKLCQSFRFAVFTGRPKAEAQLT